MSSPDVGGQMGAIEVFKQSWLLHKNWDNYEETSYLIDMYLKIVGVETYPVPFRDSRGT